MSPSYNQPYKQVSGGPVFLVLVQTSNHVPSLTRPPLDATICRGWLFGGHRGPTPWTGEAENLDASFRPVDSFADVALLASKACSGGSEVMLFNWPSWVALCQVISAAITAPREMAATTSCPLSACPVQ